MKGDFTRDTYDVAKHFSRVLMQQGRVQLDADWNEQTAILLHYVRTLAADIIGPHAGPAKHSGFRIMTNPNDLNDLKDPMINTLSDERRKTLQTALEAQDFAIGVGRYYVEGVLVENNQVLLYSEQKGYSFSSDTKFDSLKSPYLIYLDVWERHITYVEDDHIREVALGGPDTCTRAQVVWQVRVLRRTDVAGQFGCTSLEGLLARTLPQLRARARLDKPPIELCVISPESRYRGAENQLYRVEVHQGGVATTGATSATFKWSRENGSVVFPIVSLTGTTVVVENLGRDACLSLKPGDWVEVCDDDIAMSEQAGPLAQVDTIDRDTLTITLKLPNGVTSLPAYSATDAPSKYPLLRRWDHAGDRAVLGGALAISEAANADQNWIDLEDGVQISFAIGEAKASEYKAGDYWLIPARVATGDVEWPHELDSNGVPKLDSSQNPIPALQPPRGPVHYYAPLFLTGGEGRGQAKDCRCTINPTQVCPSNQ